MKKRIKIVIGVLIFVVLNSCASLDYEGEGGKLVVEGWINSDGYPIVFVSRTIPAMEEETKYSELRKYIEYFAKVKVSDGEKEVQLVGKNDKKYTPSYQYTTSELKGEVGKTYTITVQTENGQTASCKSTINKVVPLESVVPIKKEEGLYILEATFINNISDGLYYRFYVYVEDEDTTWNPSVLGVVDGSQKDGKYTVIVNRGGNLSGYSVKLGYESGSRVCVRFCTMDKTMFDYWTAFDNSQTIANNPIVPSSDNLPQIVDGAKGYWTGYGVFDTVVDIPND